MSVMILRKSLRDDKEIPQSSIDWQKLRLLPGKFLRMRLATKYVTFVETVNTWVGKAAMWLLLAILGVLSYSILAKLLAAWSAEVTNGQHVIALSTIWVMETAQFIVGAYYILGAGYSMRQGAHVRMDFLYSRWSPKVKAIVDTVTIFFVLFYLWFMIAGGWDSCVYAIQTHQHNHTVWAPPMAPIKIAMTIGMVLMFLQCTAELVKDIARIRGFEIEVKKYSFVGFLSAVFAAISRGLKILEAATDVEKEEEV